MRLYLLLLCIFLLPQIGAGQTVLKRYSEVNVEDLPPPLPKRHYLLDSAKSILLDEIIKINIAKGRVISDKERVDLLHNYSAREIFSDLFDSSLILCEVVYGYHEPHFYFVTYDSTGRQLPRQLMPEEFNNVLKRTTRHLSKLEQCYVYAILTNSRIYSISNYRSYKSQLKKDFRLRDVLDYLMSAKEDYVETIESRSNDTNIYMRIHSKEKFTLKFIFNHNTLFAVQKIKG